MIALRDLILAFADDEHLIGQQHTEWIGVTPFLEEDLAFSSIGQDELGHAALLYELALELDDLAPSDTAIDSLAYERPSDEYRSSAFTEYTTNDWAETIVRHWVYDQAEMLRWINVTGSSHQPLAEIVDRVTAEEVYHRLHADAILDSLLANADASSRLVDALERLAPLVPTVLASVDGEDDLVKHRVIRQRTDTLLPDLVTNIDIRFGRTITAPTPSVGRRSRSSSFAPLMSRMREVFDIDPAAIW